MRKGIEKRIVCPQNCETDSAPAGRFKSKGAVFVDNELSKKEKRISPSVILTMRDIQP